MPDLKEMKKRVKKFNKKNKLSLNELTLFDKKYDLPLDYKKKDLKEIYFKLVNEINEKKDEINSLLKIMNEYHQECSNFLEIRSRNSFEYFESTILKEKLKKKEIYSLIHNLDIENNEFKIVLLKTKKMIEEYKTLVEENRNAI